MFEGIKQIERRLIFDGEMDNIGYISNKMLQGMDEFSVIKKYFRFNIVYHLSYNEFYI